MDQSGRSLPIGPGIGSTWICSCKAVKYAWIEASGMRVGGERVRESLLRQSLRSVS